MWPFTKKKIEERADVGSVGFDDVLLQSLLNKKTVTRDEAMAVPTFAGCVNKICETVAIIPIKLYKKSGDSVEEIEDDRVKLLNNDTGDTFDGAAFKKAIVYDYLTNKGGYAFINRHGNKFLSINYVDADQVAFMAGVDPIFKDYKITVGGKMYEGYQFLKVLRRTRNGYEGTSIVDESNAMLTVAYTSLKFEGKLVSRGGNKKGFLETDKRVEPDAARELRDGFNRMYSEDSENVIVLNQGLKFHESSNTSVEMQLNENKQSNATEICKLFGMPPGMLTGGANAEERQQFIQYCIIPIMEELVEAINRDMLLEKEKESYFFDYDVSELTRADILTRYKAYEVGYKNRFLQIGEIRRMENLPEIDIPFFMMGLNDVLYEPESGDIFVPNMNQWANIKDPSKFPPRDETGQNLPRNAEDDADDETKEGADKDSGKEGEDEGNNQG